VRVLVVAVLCASTATYSPNIRAQGAPPSSAPLLQASDLVYQGAFRLPQGTFGGSSFDYGGNALTFNPAAGSLFMVGHPWQQQVAEVSIPAPGVGSLGNLPTAAVIQPFADVTEGRMSQVGFDPASDSPVVGGLLSYGNRLYESVYLYYDGAGTQVRSHFVSGLDLSVRGDVSGPYQIGTANTVPNMPAAGFVDGYMGLVPTEWQAALGGPVLAGNCCIPIISRTSYGPAAFAIDPGSLGAVDPLPAVPLVYYPSQHPTLGGWGSSGTLFNGVTQVTGVVFPQGTRSVLFFGRVGLGRFCYGESTTDPALDGTLEPGTTDQYYCYDPADGSKGTHGYPYAYFVWAYDALDLVAVRNGQRQPWDVQPYAAWPLNLPFAAPYAAIEGAAYDPATNRIFLTQYHGDGTMPLVHVFSLGGGSQPGAPPSVSLTSPSDGASFASGAPVHLAASASDADGTVASVAFYANTNPIGSASSPFAIDWTPAAPGTYRMTVVATDNAGNSTTSAAVTVTIRAPAVAPTVTLTSPANGTTFTQRTPIPVSATASDSDGTIASVSFYAGAALLGTVTAAPYSITWSDASPGTYRIVAVATDNDGKTATSSTATITVRCPRRC
jgi:hypothetical protein